MRYPGGKGGAGVFQTIINQFPPHRVYLEPFAGGANVWERKTPAPSSVLMDRDPATVAALLDRHANRANSSNTTILQGDALELLSTWPWVGDELVYLDPPYLHATRRDCQLYRCELSDQDHGRLLDLVASVPAMVSISGYRSAMYDEWAQTHGWRRLDFQAMTRRGVATESLWCNFPAPAALAEYSYAGSGFRERERIKRKVQRWVHRWQQLPELERNAIKAAMAAATIGCGDRGPAEPAMLASTASRGDGRPS